MLTDSVPSFLAGGEQKWQRNCRCDHAGRALAATHATPTTAARSAAAVDTTSTTAAAATAAAATADFATAVVGADAGAAPAASAIIATPPFAVAAATATTKRAYQVRFSTSDGGMRNAASSISQTNRSTLFIPILYKRTTDVQVDRLCEHVVPLRQSNGLARGLSQQVDHHSTFGKPLGQAIFGRHMSGLCDECFDVGADCRRYQI
jgi:hypothetical protein